MYSSYTFKHIQFLIDPFLDPHFKAPTLFDFCYRMAINLEEVCQRQCQVINSLKAYISELENILDELPVKICRYNAEEKRILYSNHAFHQANTDVTSIDDLQHFKNSKGFVEASPGVFEFAKRGINGTVLYAQIETGRMDTRLSYVSDFASILAVQHRISDWVVTYYNDQTKVWLQNHQEREIAVGVDVRDIFEPESFEFLKPKLARILASKEMIDFESYFPWVSIFFGDNPGQAF
jgi:hypothetical protein